MTLTPAEIFIIVLAAVLYLLILILVGRYAYLDARRRGMDGAKWTLICVLAPALAGFAIYLLVRRDLPEQACPVCGAPVETDWIACPRCAAPLPEEQPETENTPPELDDRSLSRILFVILLIPILLITAVLASAVIDSAFSSGFGGTGTVIHSQEDYLEAIDNQEINAWVENCVQESEPGTAYILYNGNALEDGRESNYLIYIPGLTKESDTEIKRSDEGLFGCTVRVDITGGGGEAALIGIFHTGRGTPHLKLYRNGERLKCSITEVDYPVDLVSIG